MIFFKTKRFYNYAFKLLNKYFYKKPNIFVFTSIFLFIPHIINGFTNTLSWDLYNNLYYGSRLLEGELLWVKEFHDKFPVLQYIFTIPALFNSLLIWRILSFVFHIISTSLFFKSSSLLINSWGMRDNHSLISIKYITVVYFILPFFLYDFTHFSYLSANLISISISLFLIYLDINSNNLIKIFIFTLALFFLSISISIRPYYLFIAIFLGLWLQIRINYLERSKLKKLDIIKSFFVWNFLLFIITFSINFLPYLITNNTNIIFDGIILNSQNINPQSITDVLRMQIKMFALSNISLLFIFLIFINIFLIKNYSYKDLLRFKNKNPLFLIDFIFLGFVCPLLIEFLIVSKHFWSHYILMFMPFIMVQALGSIILLSRKLSRGQTKNNLNLKKLIFILVFYVLLLLEALNGINKLAKSLNSEKKSADYFTTEISNYSQSKFNKLNFLDLTSQKIHLKLKHSRKGFPHPAHISHLEKDWYLNNVIYVPKSLKNKFPLSINQLFKDLVSSNINIVIVKRKSKMNQYLKESIIFKENKTLSNNIQKNYDENLIIYERMMNKVNGRN